MVIFPIWYRYIHRLVLSCFPVGMYILKVWYGHIYRLVWSYLPFGMVIFTVWYVMQWLIHVPNANCFDYTNFGDHSDFLLFRFISKTQFRRREVRRGYS